MCVHFKRLWVDYIWSDGAIQMYIYFYYLRKEPTYWLSLEANMWCNRRGTSLIPIVSYSSETLTNVGAECDKCLWKMMLSKNDAHLIGRMCRQWGGRPEQMIKWVLETWLDWLRDITKQADIKHPLSRDMIKWRIVWVRQDHLQVQFKKCCHIPFCNRDFLLLEWADNEAVVNTFAVGMGSIWSAINLQSENSRNFWSRN